MTVIVWDGSVLAVDRQVTTNSRKREEKKIYHLKDGGLFAFSGQIDFGMALLQWVEQGRDPEKWPAFQTSKDDWVPFVTANPDGTLSTYYQTPVAMPVLRAPRAWGGDAADIASGALAMGATAVQAILAVNRVSTTCGFGCDAYQFEFGKWTQCFPLQSLTLEGLQERN